MSDGRIPTSDDDMIDIQIEESLGRETLMAIDSANFRDDLFSIGGFILILLITTITGILGPRPTETKVQVTKFVEPKSHTGLVAPQSQEVSMTITNISRKNRFVSFSLSFNLDKNSNSPPDTNFSYAYKVSLSKKGKKRVKSNYVDGARIFIRPGDKTSAIIDVFSTKVINFDAIQFYATVDSVKGFSSVNLIEEHGFTQHTIFQIYFKTIFALIEIAFLVLFVARLKSVQFKLWHLEQKLTVPLVLLVILYNNPLSFFTISHPTYVTVILDTVIDCLFTVYFRFFILVLFDSLRYKNRKTDECFFVPKIAYSILDFLIMVSHGIYEDISNTTQVHTALSVITIVEYILFCGYLVWAAVSIAVAGCQVDITERYKYIIYMVSGLSALLLLGLSELFLGLMGFLENSALKFVENYAIENVFVMLIAYYHWPYEVLHDQNYIDGDDPNQATLPAEFFVNNDSDQD
jgi:hypothetical protein